MVNDCQKKKKDRESGFFRYSITEEPQKRAKIEIKEVEVKYIQSDKIDENQSNIGEIDVLDANFTQLVWYFMETYIICFRFFHFFKHSLILFRKKNGTKLRNHK